jgi:hypothetical protein
MKYTLTRSKNLSSSGLMNEVKGVAFGTRTLPLVLGSNVGFSSSSKNFAFLGADYFICKDYIRGRGIITFINDLSGSPRTSNIDNN